MAGSMRWLHRFIRRRMMPIPEDEAFKWKSRLSFAYMFFAWNAVGAVAYSIYTGKLDWADYYGLKTDEEKNMKNNEYFARNLARPGSKVKLVKMKGLSEMDSLDFDYDAEVYEKTLSQPQSELTLAQKIERRKYELDQIEKRQLAEKSQQEQSS